MVSFEASIDLFDAFKVPSARSCCLLADRNDMASHSSTKSMKTWILLPTVVDGALIALTVQKKTAMHLFVSDSEVREASTQFACLGVQWCQEGK